MAPAWSLRMGAILTARRAFTSSAIRSSRRRVETLRQPQFELNFYNKSDPSRRIGSGLSVLDTGLRLRYEISRKFAPYTGVAYAGKFGETADFTRAEGGIVNDVRFCGIRLWY
jgi:copper resistance protein B